MYQIVLDAVLCEFSLDRVARAAHTRAVRAAALNHEAVYDPVENQSVIISFVYKADEIVHCIRSYNSAFITSPFSMVMVTIGFAILSFSFFN